MPPKGPTAYFLFTEENRERVQRQLNEAAAAAAAEAAAGPSGDGAAAPDGAGDAAGAEGLAAAAATKPKSVSVAVVAKELGARWRALPEAEKERYKEAARARAVQLAEEAEAAGGAGAGDDAAGDQAGSRPDGEHDERQGEQREQQQREQQQQQQPLLPRGAVKRLMALDPDFKRASADAVWLVAAAAEALVGLLAERAARQALVKKRRTVKLEDLRHAVKHDRRLAEAGLRDVTEDAAMYEAAAEAAAAKAAARAAAKPGQEGAGGEGEGGAAGGADAGQPRQQQRGRKKKGAEEDKAQRKLSAFFGAPAQ